MLAGELDPMILDGDVPTGGHLSPPSHHPGELDGMIRVLVVASNRGFRGALVDELERQGFAIDAVADGASALARTAQAAYDVVVLDLSMPDVDGFEICRDLNEGSPRPMILMVAPPNGAEQRLASFEAGADDCVSKPVVLREVAARLRALARRRVVGLGGPAAELA